VRTGNAVTGLDRSIWRNQSPVVERRCDPDLLLLLLPLLMLIMMMMMMMEMT